MLKYGIITIGCVLIMAGCGGEDSDASETSTPDVVMEQDGVTAPNGEVDAVENITVTPLDDSICETIGERINGCGWLYTFETFAEDCAGWALSGNANKINGLEECAVKTCQPLLACLEEVVSSP